MVFFLIPRILNFFNPKITYGSLRVESIPNEASVLVDEKEVGVTPWQESKIKEGVHKIKLISGNLSWEGKIEVSSGTETFVKRILGPSPSFSGGISVSCQKTKNGFNNPGLAITAKPERVMVSVNEKEYQTPIVLDGISTGRRKIKFAFNGYQGEEIEVETKNGFLTNVDVEMIINPYGGVGEKLTEGVITEGAEEYIKGTEGLKIRKRSEWGGETLDMAEKDVSFAKWGKIKVYSIVYSAIYDINELLRGMDFYAREILGFPGVPFAYLITENGEVYEGLGVRNFDFSKDNSFQSFSFSIFQFSSGFCPIAYLSASSVELSAAAEESLVKLQAYLAEPPQQQAKLVTLLNPITIEPGSAREVSLEFQNTGEAAWEAAGNKRIFLVTAPLKRASQFYNKDSWIAVDTISLPQEEKIFPGQTAKFVFALSAPFYPLETNEVWGLLIEGRENIITDSEISLPILVWSEGLVAVEIKDTPTGFLNVRNGPSTYAELIGTVYPGEKYLYLDEEASWYKIKLRDGSEGWVIAKYAEKKT
ncbi:MAG: SH3 domain-containing protein [Candidatus Cloacimonetes bacterium]|nr:SH3 domain-containing protein [Candidatus Cloacimonadota bacterium]